MRRGRTRHARGDRSLRGIVEIGDRKWGVLGDRMILDRAAPLVDPYLVQRRPERGPCASVTPGRESRNTESKAVIAVTSAWRDMIPFFRRKRSAVPPTPPGPAPKLVVYLSGQLTSFRCSSCAPYVTSCPSAASSFGRCGDARGVCIVDGNHHSAIRFPPSPLVCAQLRPYMSSHVRHEPPQPLLDDRLKSILL